MKKVIINGKEYKAEDGTPLKDILIELGMEFPCGGTGRCGKCRIKAKDVQPTEKDRKFLSDSAIEEGWRIACDKIADDYELECKLTDAVKRRELGACNIIVSIGVKEIKIGIADDEIAEEVTVVNPLYDGNGISGICENYDKNGKAQTKLLRAVLAKESIELFEKYGKAKSETFAVAANGIFLKILTGIKLDEKDIDFNAISDGHNFDLPTEEVYFLPCVGDYIGGDILGETVNCGDNTIIIDCEELFVAVSIGKDNNEAAAMWDMSYDEVGLKAVRAVVKLLRKEGFTPFVRLYGEYAEKVEKIIAGEGLEYSFYEKKLSNPAKVLGGLRYRAKLNKEKSVTSEINVLNNEEFHKYFAE